MKTSHVIGGTICLSLAVFLAILSAVLPEDQLAFYIDGRNMPMVPVLILGIIGIGLLVTAGRPKSPSSEGGETVKETVLDPEKEALNKRLEGMGWGLFLIMLGGFSLVPHEQLPKGWWSIGVGVIMLGLNGLRVVYRIPPSGFTVFLGSIALASGIADLFGIDLPLLPILLILLGANALIKPWLEKRQSTNLIES